MQNKILFTVFTPTHNRAHLLSGLYNSLLRQTYKNFKWMLVDDGSSDNTRDVVEGFQKEGKIQIEYYFIENGFLHKAQKLSAQIVDTPYIIRIDDDDEFTDDAIETFRKEWEKITSEGASNIGEIRALAISDKGVISGNYQPKLGQPSVDTLYIEMQLKKEMQLENISCYKSNVWKCLFSNGEENMWLYDKVNHIADEIFWNRLSRIALSRYIFTALRKYHDTPISLTKVNNKLNKQNLYNEVFSRYLYLNEMRDYYYKYPWNFIKRVSGYCIYGFALNLSFLKIVRALDSPLCKIFAIATSPICWAISRKYK